MEPSDGSGHAFLTFSKLARLSRNTDAAFASALSDAEWHTRVPKDGRKVGVTVHHVATIYPLEIQLAQMLARGEPVVGVTWDGVAERYGGKAVRRYDGT